MDTYVSKSHGTYIHIKNGEDVPSGDVAIERSRTFEHLLQQHTGHERRRAGGIWRASTCPAAPSSPQHPHASLDGTCTRTQKAEGIKEIKDVGDTRCAPGWIHVGKSHGTYLHPRDGARVPSGDVAIERSRTVEHELQQNTVHERRRAGGVWRASTCPAAPSSPQHPHASLGGTYTRTQKAEGIKDVKDTRCAPRWIHMSARAMARTSICVTELVSHPEMSPLNEVAP